MTIEEKKKLFCENLNMLNKNLDWLLKSYKKVENIDFLREDLTEEDLEVLETLSNRFGRSVDILINKVLRSLDLLEMEDISRKLDAVIRAEKRGFVEDYKILIEMKDLRNELSHEYIQENLIEKFEEVIENVPKLVKIIEKINLYAKKMQYCKQNEQSG
ncbi:hypothetical protein [Sulfurihydrogenibium subterraneum]|uniref:hypothetical protein n=1 Tax=Sulfurihydrogenibium subterraneum TaxID=171121 RepID=UPI000A5702E7|nr:hypothetical protein [Sulfurihydrogenibium subterraneum]